MEVGGQLHAPAALPPDKSPGTRPIGDWVGPRAGLDAVAKKNNPSPCRESHPDRPIRILVTILTELPHLKPYKS